MKSTIYFFLSIVIFCGCSSNDEQDVKTINIDPKESGKGKFSSVFEEIQYLPLVGGLIGEPRKILFKEDSIFFAFNNQTASCIYVYTQNGQLAKSICHQGDGPGQYLNIRDVNFNPDNEISVLDRKMLTIIDYSRNGKYVGGIRHFMFANSFLPISKDQMLFFCGGATSKVSNSMLVLYNRVKDKVEKQFRKIPDDLNQQYLNMFDRNNFQIYKDSILFFYGFNDTIFYYNKENSTLTPRLFVNFNGKNVPNNFLEKGFSDVQVFYEQIRKTDYAFRIIGYQETDQHITFIFEYLNKFKFVVFHKKDQKYSIFDSLEDDMSIPGLKLENLVDIGPYTLTEDGRLVFIIPGEQLSEFFKSINSAKLNAETSDLMKKVKENQFNPVLLIAKLKGKS